MPHRPQRGLSTSTGAAIIDELAHKKGPFNAFCAFCAFCALLGGAKVIRLTKEDLAAGNAETALKRSLSLTTMDGDNGCLRGVPQRLAEGSAGSRIPPSFAGHE
jgi:hypothetical protein